MSATLHFLVHGRRANDPKRFRAISLKYSATDLFSSFRCYQIHWNYFQASRKSQNSLKNVGLPGSHKKRMYILAQLHYQKNPKNSIHYPSHRIITSLTDCLAPSLSYPSSIAPHSVGDFAFPPFVFFFFVAFLWSSPCSLMEAETKPNAPKSRPSRGCHVCRRRKVRVSRPRRTYRLPIFRNA